MNRIHVNAGEPYDVLIETGMLRGSGSKIREILPGAEKICIISDTNVHSIYGQAVEETITGEGYDVCRHILQPSEASKNAENYIGILNTLASNTMTKSDAIVALGGGVVGDIAGFAAATYLRGIPYLQIPTSLIAMVDSSVGGKTAIDLPKGKNLAGAFYQPKIVICDPDVLSTLPADYFTDGCAEVIKYGILNDRELFDHLEKRGQDFDREYVISRCVAIKAEYVEEDEFDNGQRQKLNLGHTIGHGIEAASSYEISHGRAVAIGTEYICRMASAGGYLSGEDAGRIHDVLTLFKLPINADLATEKILSPIMNDKKRRGSEISIIVPHSIGDCRIHKIPVEEIPSLIV